MESRSAQLNTAGELTADAAVTDMEEYTRLLLQKEKLQKECVQLDMEFDELFGPLILEEFQAQIELVRQRIELSLYIQAMNQGQDPDPEEIEKAVAQRTANWQKQLEEMAEYQETLKCRSIVPPEEMRQISRLYRKMVKMIHPDLHPELEHDPRIRELWDRLQTAYRLNALDEMEEIAVLIHEVLADSDTAPVQIPDLTEKSKSCGRNCTPSRPQIPGCTAHGFMIPSKSKNGAGSIRTAYSPGTKPAQGWLQSWKPCLWNGKAPHVP